jgi:hypothetical protein
MLATVAHGMPFLRSSRGGDLSPICTKRPSLHESTNDSGKEQLRVLEGRALDLIIEVAPLVVADEVGADVLVAGTLVRLGLMLETTEKGLCNILFEVDARVLINDILSISFKQLTPARSPKLRRLGRSSFFLSPPDSNHRASFKSLPRKRMSVSSTQSLSEMPST